MKAHLRDSACRVFIKDVRVREEKTNAFYYPDLLVHCGRGDQPVDLDAVTVHDPVLLMEILSQSTEATDRREKLLAYRTIPSLSEYVLVSQEEARIEIHRRRGDIGWEKIEHTGEETVDLASVDLHLPMRNIYEGVPPDTLRGVLGPA